jgi:SpoVK/Ycf46/Vps4 family AAA+-type ATPase
MKEKNNQKETSQDLLRCVEKIALDIKTSGISKEMLLKNERELKKLSDFLEISQIQVVLFCVIFTINFGSLTVDLEDIARYIDCSPVSVVSYLPDLDIMAEKKLLRRQVETNRRRRGGGGNLNSIEFYVNRDAFESLRKGEKFISKKIETPDVYSLMVYFENVFQNFHQGEYTITELHHEILATLNRNITLPFVREIRKLQMDIEDLTLFMLICSEFIDDEESVNLLGAIKYLYADFSDRMRVRKEFLKGTHTLLKNGLVMLEESQFKSERHVMLTDFGMEILLQDDKDIFVTKKEKKKSSDFILASDIQEKQLFFREKESKGLEFLTDTLKPENHANLVGRLKDAGMRTGVTVLLYGAPGTGKTESVYQIARQTGRDIRMISISETKSMWFGESEKLIKKVFDEYRRRVEKSKVAPILLFNEADGIFSTRKKIGSSSVAQTENAIQNIILQEMEDLNGILIATTNLTQNLDQAFERRFLYKLCFEKPDPECRIRIWLDKVKTIPVEYVENLSGRFELSGGQIENIARKCILQQALYGVFPSLDEIESFCNEEQMNRNAIQRIGFSYTSKEM